MATSTYVVNGAFIYILAFTGLLFFLIIFLLVYFAVRYRASRNPHPADISGNAVLEVLWIVVPTLLVMTMFFYGLTGFNFLRHPPPDSLHVKVLSRQWAWQFQYDNGTISPSLIAPVDRNVRCELTSQDVIHGFFVPAFRVKQDAVPGMTTQTWFNATETGTYDILCTQYCGTGHSAMLAKLVVVPQDQFDAWYAGKSVAIAGVPSPGAVPPSVGATLIQDLGCIGCHSTDGSKGVGPTFKGLYDSTVVVITNGKQRNVEAEEEYLRKSITDPGADVAVGFPNVMPKLPITDQQIDQIIQYLHSLK